MINTNGGLFYGTLIDAGNISAILKDVDGNTVTGNVTCSRGETNGNAIPSFNNSRDYAVLRTYARLGYGRTLPTIDDYNLENEVSDNVNINDILICCNAARGINSTTARTTQSIDSNVDGSVCYEYTFYNNSDNDITFYEVGQFVNTDSVAPTHPFMAIRNVNENGWTVKARECITLNIEINYAGNTMLTKQGARFFSNLFSGLVGMYGFKTATGGAPTGSVQAVPTGSTANTQAITENSISTSSPRGICIRMGYGTTPVTVEDFKLAEETSEDVNINNVLSVTRAVLNNNRQTNGKWSYEYTVSNTGSENITFKEIGLFIRDGFGFIMLGRKVNETGWTVEAGNTLNISVDISIAGATNSDEV